MRRNIFIHENNSPEILRRYKSDNFVLISHSLNLP